MKSTNHSLDIKPIHERSRGELISNRIKTPDGTILISRSTHDLVKHTDSVNGETYYIAGGRQYTKRAFSKRYEELSVYSNDSFDLIRNSLEWEMFGINGKEKLQWRTLCCMSDTYIQHILLMRIQISKTLKYRIKKNIVIHDSKFNA